MQDPFVLNPGHSGQLTGYFISEATAAAAALSVAFCVCWPLLLVLVAFATTINERVARQNLLLTAYKLAKDILFLGPLPENMRAAMRKQSMAKAVAGYREEAVGRTPDGTHMATLEVDLIRLEASVAAAEAAGVVGRKRGQMFVTVDVREPWAAPSINPKIDATPKLHRRETCFNTTLSHGSASELSRDSQLTWIPAAEDASGAARGKEKSEPMWVDVPIQQRGLLTVHITVTDAKGATIAMWDATVPSSKCSRSAADRSSATRKSEMVHDAIEMFATARTKEKEASRAGKFEGHHSWTLYLRIGYTTPTDLDSTANEVAVV